MEIAAAAARFGNRILNIIVGILTLLLFLYGAYCLWDTYMTGRGAFLSDDLLQYKPVPGQEENPTLNELMAINPDVVGWLTVDETHIDYPVVQGGDDMEYINKNVYGEFALSGSIFLSCVNSRDFSDPYSLVYGHHMANGAMFGDVVEFAAKEYFDAHTTGTLYLPDETLGITLFACVETSASDPVVYNPQAQAEDVSGLISYLKENAVQYREIGVTKDDRIIGLSTCAETETNSRVIVFGRLDDTSQTEEGGVLTENE